MPRPRSAAFTFVELVVVILLLAILATVAVLYYLRVAEEASINGLRHSLYIIRDAIEMYAAQNSGTLPGGGENLQDDLRAYLQGDFPPSTVGVKNSQITYVTGSAAITGTGRSAEGTGWKYNKETGQFICNHEDWDDY